MQWTRGIGILQSREFHRSTPSRSGFCPGERPTLGTRCRSRKLLAIHSNCCDKNWCKFSTTQESIIPIFDVLVLLYVEKLLLCIPPYYFSPFIELHCKHSPFFVRRRPHRISKALAYAETVPGVIPFNFVDIALILLLKIWDYFFLQKNLFDIYQHCRISLFNGSSRAVPAIFVVPGFATRAGSFGALLNGSDAVQVEKLHW